MGFSSFLLFAIPFPTLPGQEKKKIIIQILLPLYSFAFALLLGYRNTSYYFQSSASIHYIPPTASLLYNGTWPNNIYIIVVDLLAAAPRPYIQPTFDTRTVLYVIATGHDHFLNPLGRVGITRQLTHTRTNPKNTTDPTTTVPTAADERPLRSAKIYTDPRGCRSLFRLRDTLHQPCLAEPVS